MEESKFYLVNRQACSTFSLLLKMLWELAVILVGYKSKLMA